MIARRLTFATLVLLCVLVGVFAARAVPSMAVATHFGSPGEGSGRIDQAYGMAIDQATGGDLVVADRYNHRIDKFDASGEFLTAWGWRVDESHPAEELQTCTSFCEGGSTGSGAGEYASEGPHGVAVDNDPSSSSYGDVYVVDWENFRVEKFDSTGKFLLMFGGGVNETTKADVCVAGEACTAGTQGTADGQFDWYFEGSFIAVGPGGSVYIGDEARVQVFTPSGVWQEDISLSGLSSTGKVTALAVDASGDMFVKDSEVPGVRELEPSGLEESTRFDMGSESIDSIALDASDDLFVGDSNGGFHVSEYDSTGKEIERFASKTAEFNTSMTFSDALDELYVGDVGTVWVLRPPPPGPLVEPGSVSSSAGQRGHANLEASVNPEGEETTYRFEYVDEADFQASGYASASSTAAVSIGSSFEDQSASALLTGLVPGGTYHYRIVATNSSGTTTGPDETLTMVPPALVNGPWVADLAATSVTLAAEINPLGANTEYRLEYGTSTAYGQTLTGSVGEGTSPVRVSFHRQGLLPVTLYHYRIVVHNEVGTVEGSDHTFTTQHAGGALALPDGRQWELVSPADKTGALIEPVVERGQIQAASDGSGISYVASEPLGEDQIGRGYLSQVLSVRGPSGWRSEALAIRHALPTHGEPASGLLDTQSEYRLFSSDLSLAAVEPTPITAPLSPQATERTIYLRNDADGSYLPLVTNADVPPGTEFGGEKPGEEGERLEFAAATPDMSHVVLESPFALTPEAVSRVGDGENIYEWSAGGLQLVNVMPNGEAATTSSCHKPLLGPRTVGAYEVAHSISTDGRWIVWQCNSGSQGESTKMYVRDMVDKKTVSVAGQYAVLEGMSNDGSKVFFLENGDLFEFDTETDSLTDLTANHGTAESTAGVRNAVLGTSEDGSYAYFVATGVLANGALGGGNNLYLLHYVDGSWATSYIATLSGEDENSWFGYTGSGGEVVNDLSRVSSRVSPDGRYLAFMSNRSLTGYDNIDANSGQPDEEVYLYDAASGRLACASCDPTGARPVGVLDSPAKQLLVDRPETWGSHNDTGSHWLAGSVPGWHQGVEEADHQPRYLSNSGQLFFESPDALVPQDTNGIEDVYQYEPSGVGGCTSADATFSERSEGCVDLISSGTSSSESAFFDASEDGDDAFFVTASRLTAADYDTSYDVYDAHLCSTAVPCETLAVLPPPCTTGDSCKAAPGPQPAIFGLPPSATFSGTGNVVEQAKSVIKPKKGEVKRKTKPKRRKGKKQSKSKKKSKDKKLSRSRMDRTNGKGDR